MFANVCLSWLNNLIRTFICGIRKCLYYFHKHIDINSSISREQGQGKLLFSGGVVLVLWILVCLFVLGFLFVCLWVCFVCLLRYFQWVNQSGVNELVNHSSLDTDLPPVVRNRHKMLSPWHCPVLKRLRALGHGATEPVVQARAVIAALDGSVAHGL